MQTPLRIAPPNMGIKKMKTNEKNPKRTKICIHTVTLQTWPELYWNVDKTSFSSVEDVGLTLDNQSSVSKTARQNSTKACKYLFLKTIIYLSFCSKPPPLLLYRLIPVTVLVIVIKYKPRPLQQYCHVIGSNGPILQWVWTCRCELDFQHGLFLETMWHSDHFASLSVLVQRKSTCSALGFSPNSSQNQI